MKRSASVSPSPVAARDERDRRRGRAGELVAGLVLVEVEQRGRLELRQRGLQVPARIAAARIRRRLHLRQLAAADEQAPYPLERHPPDELLDVHAAVAQRVSIPIGFRDLGLERDDPFKSSCSHALSVPLSSILTESMLTTSEASRRLGVKPETLYAYVSRGLLTRHTAPDGRRSLFAREEIERLAARARRGGRAGALEVVVDTELTLLDPAGALYYRGHDVTAARPRVDLRGRRGAAVGPEARREAARPL